MSNWYRILIKHDVDGPYACQCGGKAEVTAYVRGFEDDTAAAEFKDYDSLCDPVFIGCCKCCQDFICAAPDKDNRPAVITYHNKSWERGFNFLRR